MTFNPYYVSLPKQGGVRGGSLKFYFIMSVFYKLTQNKNEKMTGAYLKWYASVVPTETKTLKDISEIIQRNCSMKKSDVNAVLTELPEVMKDMLQNSFRVRVDGLGTFKIGMHSRGVENIKDYNVNEHVKSLRVIFMPESESASTGKRVRTLLQGITLSDISKKASKEALDAQAAAETAEP